MNTQIVSELLTGRMSPSEAKRPALKAALQGRSIRISEAPAATFKLYDVMAAPTEERAQP